MKTYKTLPQLSALSAAVALICLGSAGAQTVDPTNIPVNSQVGSIEIPYQCSFPVIGTQTLTVKFTGSMATSVGPGEPFYMTDGSGQLTFPLALTNLMYQVLGVRSASGQITALNFSLVNATPTTINALANPIVVTNEPVVLNQPVTMVLPATGFEQVGPLYASSIPGQVLVKMGGATGNLTLHTASGGQILWNMGVSCSAPSPQIIVLGMTVGGAPSSVVSAPHTNIRTEDLATPLSTQSGSLRFPLSCNIEGLGVRQLAATFTGTAPVLYAPGQVFNAASNGYGTLDVPGSVVSELLALDGSAATQIGGVINQLNFTTTNTSPTSINMAATPLTTQVVPAVPGQDANVRIPASGTLTVGPFKAASSGATETALYIGQTGGTISLQNAAGQVVGSHTVACAVPSPAVTMVSVTIGGTAVSPASISALLPASGAAAGGNSVAIFGSNFTGATGVLFGGVAATSFTVNSSGLITAVAPAQSAGKVAVTVQGLGGTTLTNSSYYTFN